MIRVLLCCGGGFSSSYVAERMKKEIIAKNLSNQLEMEFSPFSLVLERHAGLPNVYPRQALALQGLAVSSAPQIPRFVYPNVYPA